MKKIFIFIFTIVILVGCSNGEDTFEEKNYTPDADDITSIDVKVIDRDIEIVLSKDNAMHVHYFESKQEKYAISTKDKAFTLTTDNQKKWSDYIGLKPSSKYRKIIIQVPTRLIEKMHISTTNGDIQVPQMNIQEMSLSSNGGNLLFEKLNVRKKLNLENKNGTVKGSIIGNESDFSIHSKVKKSKSNIKSNNGNKEKQLHLIGNNSKVNVEFTKE